jgi:hypothetical protein
MRIVAAAAVFGAGYVLGTKAGRERYAQIVAVTRRASQRIDTSRLGGIRPARMAAGSHPREDVNGAR